MPVDDKCKSKQQSSAADKLLMRERESKKFNDILITLVLTSLEILLSISGGIQPHLSLLWY